jgi:hypothetical protein
MLEAGNTSRACELHSRTMPSRPLTSTATAVQQAHLLDIHLEPEGGYVVFRCSISAQITCGRKQLARCSPPAGASNGELG